MVDRTELYRLVGDTDPADCLEDPAWSGGFDGYLRALMRRPELAQGVHRRLWQAVAASADSPDRPGPPASLAGLAGALEDLASVADPLPRLLLVETSGRVEWESDVAWIVRRLADHSRTPEGAFFTFHWVAVDSSGRPTGDPAQANADLAASLPCPCREEPLRLVPRDSRPRVLEAMSTDREDAPRTVVDGPLCPSCRRVAEGLLARSRGDWVRMIAHVRIDRVLPSAEVGACVGRVTPAGPSSWALDGNRGLVIADLEEAAPSWDRLEALLDPHRGTVAASTPLDLVVLWPVLHGADPGDPPETLRTRVARVRRPG